MKRIAVILLSMCLTILIACSDTANNKTQAISEDETMVNAEEQKVLEAYEAMQQAMIDKDIKTLDRIVKDGTTFTHMSGKVQTKQEYFGEIADGTLNYRRYDIKNCTIKVNGDTATLTADVTLTAKVYGISGSWTLPVNAHFERINGKWIYCNG